MISSRSNYRESKSIHHGGDSMNGSRGINRCRVPAFMAMLFGSIFTILLLPAYGQQEVDPTWYDPWAAPTTAGGHPSQPPAVAPPSQPPGATPPYQPTGKAWSPAPDAR